MRMRIIIVYVVKVGNNESYCYKIKDKLTVGKEYLHGFKVAPHKMLINYKTGKFEFTSLADTSLSNGCNEKNVCPRLRCRTHS